MKNSNLTEGKILSKLLGFTFPVLGAMVLQMMYGAVDILVVGRFGTAADISAVSTGSQIMASLTNVFVGLSMGSTILIGNSIGAGQGREAGRAIAAGIKLFSVIGVVATILVPVFSTEISTIMQAPAEALILTGDYIRICGYGMLFIVAYNLLGSIFRGIGDSKTPLLAVSIACVLNIGGDLYFVKGLGMGAGGAALATTISQAISVVICLAIIKKRGLPFPFGKESFTGTRPVIRRTFVLGFPIALQDLLVSISFLVITTIVNGLGLIASAGVGVAEKVCNFVMLVPSAFSQALSAFVAQNLGAGRKDRATRGLVYAIGVSFAIALFISYFAFFKGYLLTGIFTDETEVAMAGWQYLKAYAIDVLLTSWMFCMVGYFNGRGRTKFVMIQGVVSAFCVRIPVSFIMSRQVPVSLFKIGLATPSSTILQVILCLLYLAHLRRLDRMEKLQ